MSTWRSVLLTGAAGRIGSAFVAEFPARFQWRLADRETVSDAPSGAETIRLDVVDPDACRAACAGIDTVVHLAADPDPDADFDDSLLNNNIRGTYNVFRAAKEAGCARVVFASSVHAVFGYPFDVPVPVDGPVRPVNMYGVSKTFGEATAHAFAYSQGLSSIAIRIGAYENDWIREAATPENLSAYISPRDMNQLLVRAIETPGVQFAIVHGISNNRVKRLSLDHTRALLGYEPVDDGFEIYRDYMTGAS
ncbi:MAG: NAD(P)-dependent oxidoreductase [Chloroflexota bacterium]|nr:NAD(P)-dependent oxidoreductase [Chloroflexota bacterium]